MNVPLLTLELRYEQDVVLTRQRARQIAELLGFDALEQTRIATAVSEIARNAFQYAGGGKVTCWVEDAARAVFVVQIHDQGPGIPHLETLLGEEEGPEPGGWPGIRGARRLMDEFRIVSSETGTTVRLGKNFPERRAVTRAELARLSGELARRKPQNPVEEIQQQNQELLQTLSELRRRQAEVERLNAELEETNQGIMALYAELSEADRRKDQFLAMLAHELRNPLAPIANALYLLGRRGGDAAAVERARDVMERQVGHLTRLVNDLLDVSRIARGKVILRQEFLDLVALVRAAVEDHRSVFATAGLSLLLDLPPEPVLVYGDATRLTQILGNLLSNALKFTEPGGQVTVRVAVEGAAVVTVRDTGIGIEPELLPRVFDSFSQADNSLDRTRGGLGLGLSVARGLVELHGGQMSARSEGAGRGSEFSFTVAVTTGTRREEEGARSDDPPSAAQPQLPLCLLVIEDNQDQAALLKELLEQAGHQVHVALTGSAGVTAAAALRPDLVLCDLGLPGMDGYAVAAALRREPATAGAPLIAISGYGQEEDQRRSLEAGFDLHLIKPVNFAMLERLLQKHSAR